MNIKNPLNIIFGAFLKQERNEIRKSSSDMATGLDLGESIYRMIEAGSAPFNVSRTSHLIRCLSGLKLIPSRLSVFYMAIQMFDYEFKESRYKIKDIEAIDYLEPDLEYFFEKISSFLLSNPESTKYKQLLHGIAVPELKRYLCLKNYRIRTPEQFQQAVIEEYDMVPSLQMPAIVHFLKSQAGHIPLHIGPVAKEWEEKEAHTFRRLRGLYRDTDLILSEQNLKHFQYPYLFLNSFDLMEIILVDRKSAKSLKNTFIKRLSNVRGSDVSPFIADKIHFKTISDSLLSTVEPLLKGRDDIFPKLKAYWSFTNNAGIEIGFVGGADGANNYAINLPRKESLERKDLFNTIWNDH